MSCCTTISVVILLLVNISAVEECSPKLEESSATEPKIDGLIDIECILQSCDNTSKVVFQKTGVVSDTTWTSVYEGVNNTLNYPLDTQHEYSLKNRQTYYAIRTKHSLTIDPAQLVDHGKWRCVVHDKSGKHDSIRVPINIYVTPAVDAISITPQNPSLVKNQSVQFTCVVDGIHPEPDVVWVVNGKEYSGGKANNRQGGDWMWSVQNTKELSIQTIGNVDVVCEMRTNSKPDWVNNKVTIDVKEEAKVLTPATKNFVNTTDGSTFTLNCTGSGHKRRISWKKDGGPIDEEHYNIDDKCEPTNGICESSISSKPLAKPVTCENLRKYTGDYTCVVSLAEPYDKSPVATSPKMEVIVLQPSSTSKLLSFGHCNRNIPISCDLCASGDSTVSWSLNGESLNNHDKSYYIGEIGKQHFGNYTKTVQNELGTVSCNVTVIHDESIDEMCKWLKACIAVGLTVACLVVIVITVYCLCRKTNTSEAIMNSIRRHTSGAAPGSNDKAESGTMLAHDTGNRKTENETLACGSGPVYGNVNKSGAPTQAPPQEAIYSQVNKPKKGQVFPEPTKATDPDELHYADVEVIKGKNGKKKTSPKTQNPMYEPTEYASIDYTKSAKPDGP